MAIDVWYTRNDKYSRLSNLAERPFSGITGTKYVTVEQAYQSNKSGKFDSKTYSKYYKAGMKVRGLPALTENGYNIILMTALIKASFDQNDKERMFLISTRDEEITHDMDRSIWRTKFPEILTDLREYYKYN